LFVVVNTGRFAHIASLADIHEHVQVRRVDWLHPSRSAAVLFICLYCLGRAAGKLRSIIHHPMASLMGSPCILCLSICRYCSVPA